MSTVHLLLIIGLGFAGLAKAICGLKQEKEAPTDCEAAPEPEPESQDPKWIAIGGDRLELGSTGFYIVLQAKPGVSRYLGFSPEGAEYGFATHLVTMKHHLEARARERAEFNVDPKDDPLARYKRSAQ